MKQGLAIMKAPIELIVLKGKYKLELKNSNDQGVQYLQWDDQHITSGDVQALKEFVEIVYRAGFSDGSVAGMNK